MKTFDTLYKRAKTGAIQYWRIEVVKLAGSLDGTWNGNIFKESGQLGTTSPLKHQEIVTDGKQKRNAYEQAEFQAESDWKKKKDEGYKTLEDLGIDHQNGGVHHGLFTINGVIQVPAKSFEEVLDIALPEFNTDASGNVKPMLAKAVDWNKVRYPCFVQPKLDGVRCLMVVTPGDVRFLSRKGKDYMTLHHIAETAQEAQETNPDGPMSFILDGEIYSDELSFQQISSAVKKESEHTPLLKFRAYDIVNDESQIGRLRTCIELVGKIKSEHITLVEHTTCSSEEEVKAYHDEYVSKGYEGAMIRHLDGRYGQGQRSSDLLKVKEFDETEYTIIDFELGQREEDLIAVCRDTVGGVFRAKMTGNASYKKELWEWWTTPMETRTKNKFTNPQLTVKHFGRTDDGLPRFPVGKAIRDYE